MEQVGGCQRVVEGTVAGAVIEAEAVGEGPEATVGDLVAEQSPGEGEGVDRPVGEAGPALLSERGVEERHVEADVVADDDGVAEELEQGGHDRLDARGPGDHGLGDPGEHGDLWRDRATRIDEGVVAPQALAPSQLHRADLGDAAVGGRPARRLEVEHDEGHVVEGRPEVVEAPLRGDERAFGHPSSVAERMFAVKGRGGRGGDRRA